MPKRTFKKKDLQELIWGGSASGFDVISCQLKGNSRWSLNYELIFKFEDKYYKSGYSAGATENQNESPYEYDEDDIECDEVKPVEKVVIVYE